MAMNTGVKKNDRLIIWSKVTGFMWAISLEDKLEHDGLSDLVVEINSTELPGISQASIDTNIFEVWQSKDVKALQKVAEHFLKREWVR